MTSLRTKIVKAALRIYTYPYRKAHLSLSRTVKLKVKKYSPPKNFGYCVKTFNGVKTEILSPPNAAKDLYIVQFHGGGHTQCMNSLYRKTAERYAKISGLTVYSIDYRTGSGLKFPSVHDECFKAYKGLPAGKVIAVGDSFGANLMLSTCLRLRDENMPLPRALVCVSAFADLGATGSSYEKNCRTDPMYSLPKKQSFAENEKFIRRITPYTGDTDFKNPYISPAFAKLDGFPPMLIQCGDCETSESDSDMIYENALKAGVQARLTKYEGAFHDFQYLVPSLKESKAAWKEISAFILRISKKNKAEKTQGRIDFDR